MSNVQLVAK